MVIRRNSGRAVRARTATCALWLASLLAPTGAFSQALEATSRQAIADQLEEDLTIVPAGMGAILVPTLSGASSAAPVIVYHGQDQVASSETGKRIPLPPGAYRVMVGHGPRATRPVAKVHLTVGATTTVEPFYGGLQLHLVDADGLPQRGSGTLYAEKERPVARFELNDMQVSVKPFVLKPGAYEVVLDEDAEGRLAVVVAAGQLQRFRMVATEGELIGSGFGAPNRRSQQASPFRANWIVGGTGSFDRRTHAVTGFNGDMLFVSLFTRGSLNYNQGRHVARLKLFVDQSFGGVDNVEGQNSPFRWLTSRTEAEALYQYKLLGSPIAPYLRLTGRTSLAPTHYLPAGPTSIARQDAAGAALSTTAVDAGDRVRMLKPFAPLSLQEGVGVGLAVLDNHTITFEVRGGAAMRQAFYSGGSYLLSSDDDGVVLREFKNNRRYGGALSAVAELRLNRRFSIQSSFDAFIPHQQLFGDDRLRPVFYWDNTFAAKIGQFASVVYDLSLSRIEVEVPNVSVTSGLAVRLQHALF